jgi:hypothetical protein
MSALTPGITEILDRLTDPIDRLLADAKQLAGELGVLLVDKDDLVKDDQLQRLRGAP